MQLHLAISRQTIHNWMETKEHFGIEGLTQGYNSGQSKSRRKQREIHQEKLACGNKSELVAAIRAKDRQDHESRQLKFDFTFAEGNELPITSEEQAFAEELRIPRNPATHSTGIRSVIPVESGQVVGAKRRCFLMSN